jgi:hypothetical protein
MFILRRKIPEGNRRRKRELSNVKYAGIIKIKCL